MMKIPLIIMTIVAIAALIGTFVYVMRFNTSFNCVVATVSNSP